MRARLGPSGLYLTRSGQAFRPFQKPITQSPGRSCSFVRRAPSYLQTARLTHGHLCCSASDATVGPMANVYLKRSKNHVSEAPRDGLPPRSPGRWDRPKRSQSAARLPCPPGRPRALARALTGRAGGLQPRAQAAVAPATAGKKLCTGADGLSDAGGLRNSCEVPDGQKPPSSAH